MFSYTIELIITNALYPAPGGLSIFAPCILSLNTRAIARGTITTHQLCLSTLQLQHVVLAPSPSSA